MSPPREHGGPRIARRARGGVRPRASRRASRCPSTGRSPSPPRTGPTLRLRGHLSRPNRSRRPRHPRPASSRGHPPAHGNDPPTLFASHPFASPLHASFRQRTTSFLNPPGSPGPASPRNSDARDASLGLCGGCSRPREIRSAMHPAILSSRLAIPAPRRSRCPGGSVHGLLEICPCADGHSSAGRWLVAMQRIVKFRKRIPKCVQTFVST